MQINVSAKKWQHIQQMAAIGEMTTGIVHDLKNQLACIGANMGLLELLNDDQESVEKYVANMKRQVGYANEMVELMLRMGSRETGHTTFDLALLMDDVATFFERAAGRGITIKTYTDKSDHLISGCQASISNSILNLCANARDAVINESGEIEVSLTRDRIEKVENDILNQNVSGECSILMVRDNGCGIEPDKLDTIFEPFFTTKGAVAVNMGMGLSNVVHTAREHGISLTVDSELGVGTMFKLYFKAAV